MAKLGTTLLLLVLSLSAFASAWDRGHVGYDRLAQPYSSFLANAPSDCHAACDKDKECLSWRYDPMEHMCNVQSSSPLPTLAAHMISGVRSQALTPRAFVPLRVGATIPQGWMLEQLQLQAEGLSGHLALFWPDIVSSVWIGGNQDGGLHERAPYWLNGLVPLTFLLQAAHTNARVGADFVPASNANGHHSSVDGKALCTEGVDMAYGDILETTVADVLSCYTLCNNTDNCIAFVVDDCDSHNVMCWLKSQRNPQTAVACRCLGFVPPHPPKPVDLLAQTHQFLDYVMAHQDPKTGWLGPADTSVDGNKYWGRFDMLLAMAAYAEANSTAFEQVSISMMNFMLGLQPMLHTLPLEGWSANRGQDLALSIQWLLLNAPQGHEQDLYAMLQLVYSQTNNWELWFDTFTQGAGNHGVNNAQALRSSAIWYVGTGNESFAASSRRRLPNMDKAYGLPHGVFCADEVLCETDEAHMPSRGTELCAVVEAMYSYTTMFSVHGDVAFADRAERIAFNANPATWSSPRGGDMWAHQYLQAVNEINAVHANDHVWTHDGPDAELYGLEPNYGCCTANFNQGWPKFANMAFYTTADGGIAVGVYIPARAPLPNGASISINTTYPFEDVVRVTVVVAVTTPLYLRIPAWATKTKATFNGVALPTPANGTMLKLVLTPGTSRVLLDFNPDIRLEHWYSNGTVSVHRGPLFFALPIQATFTTLQTYAYQSADYQALPNSTWAYAIDLSQPLTFVSSGYVDGTAPFNKTAWPVHIEATLRPLRDWDIAHNSAAPPPVGPVCVKGGCGSAVRANLVPYGGTTLRIGEFPIA